MKKEALIQDPNKRQTIIIGSSVTFRYPDHFTDQQRGFTPAVGVKGYFPRLRAGKPKSLRIADSKELEMMNLWKDEDKKTRKESHRKAFKILAALPKSVRNIYA